MVDEMISICEHIAQAEEFVESLRKFKNIDKKALNKVSQLQHFVMSCYSEDNEEYSAAYMRAGNAIHFAQLIEGNDKRKNNYREYKKAVKDVKKMLHKERIRVKGEVLKKLKGI